MVTIICDNKVLVVGIGEKGLYKLVNLKTRKAQTIVIVENTDVLQHERYGHLTYQYLSMLSNTNIVDGIPFIQNAKMYVQDVKWEININIHLLVVKHGKPKVFYTQYMMIYTVEDTYNDWS